MKFNLLFFIFLSTNLSFAAGKNILYKEGTTELEGYLSETSNKGKKAPGFILVPDWMGLSDDNKQEAAYNALADLRSRKHFDLFIEEVLANK